MRITRPLRFVVKRTTKKTFRKVIVTTGVFAVIATSAIFYQNFITRPGKVFAATAVDTCFAFDAVTGTITDYFYHEANNYSLPSCPRDPDIPATIGGVQVKRIGDSAFYSKRLTSVTIPLGVVTIADYAFAANELSSLVLPDTVASIGYWSFGDNQLSTIALSSGMTSLNDTNQGGAFSFNKITEVAIPDTIKTVGKTVFMGQNQFGKIIDWIPNTEHLFWSGDNAVIQAAMDEIWMVKLYTQSPSNPNKLTDTLTTEADYVVDINNNGTSTDAIGGYVVNPATVAVEYQKSDGTNLLESKVFSSPDHLSLSTDFLVRLFARTVGAGGAITYTIPPYYRIEQSITFTAPDIAGYVTPTPQTKSFVLGASTNTVTFVYAPPAPVTPPSVPAATEPTVH